MRILFVNQTYMKWYRGANNFDHPVNGGSWPRKHGDDCADVYNFLPFGRDVSAGRKSPLSVGRN